MGDASTDNLIPSRLLGGPPPPYAASTGPPPSYSTPTVCDRDCTTSPSISSKKWFIIIVSCSVISIVGIIITGSILLSNLKEIKCLPKSECYNTYSNIIDQINKENTDCENVFSPQDDDNCIEIIPDAVFQIKRVFSSKTTLFRGEIYDNNKWYKTRCKISIAYDKTVGKTSFTISC